MKYRFGDEKGVFWLPPPDEQREPSTRKGGGTRTKSPFGKVHVPRGPLPESDWVLPTSFPRLHGLVGFDLETRDPLLKKKGPGWAFRPALGDKAGYVVGVSFSWGAGPDRGKVYYPLRHEGGGNMDDAEAVMRYVRDVVTDPAVQLVSHNAQYDLGWLLEQGIQPANLPYDTQIAVALLDEHRGTMPKGPERGYSLNACALSYLKRPKNEDLLNRAAAHFGVDPKSGLWKLPAQFVGPYGASDAEDTLDLWLHVEPKLRAQKLLRVFTLELNVTQVLLAMRQRGRRIDQDKAELLRVKYTAKLDEAQRKLNTLAGRPINVGSNPDMLALFKARGLVDPKATEGSFDKAFLKAHASDEASRWVSVIRRYGKALSTYVNGYLLDMPVNGRLHGTYNQTASDEGGTVSGRTSSSLPNEQNWPARDGELGKDIRECSLPEEGTEWMTGDFSAQEPRLAAHLAIAVGAEGAEEIRREYHANPRLDTHRWVADLLDIIRPDAKTIQLAVMYGRGEASTCRALNLPTVWEGEGKFRREYAGPEGKAKIEAYHARFPFMRDTADRVKRKAKREGWIKTLLGRRCHFGEHASPDFTAFNRWVQGSAADQAKEAMVQVHKEGVVPLVMVHDSLDCPTTSRAQGARIKEIMENAVPLLVPFIVDVGYGSNWAEAK